MNTRICSGSRSALPRCRPTAIAEKIGAELIAALTIRAASLRIDEVTAPRYAREINLKTEPMRIRFAMRFGDDRSDEEAAARLGWRVSGDAQGARARSVQLAILAVCAGFNLGGAGGS